MGPMRNAKNLYNPDRGYTDHCPFGYFHDPGDLGRTGCHSFMGFAEAGCCPPVGDNRWWWWWAQNYPDEKLLWAQNHPDTPDYYGHGADCPCHGPVDYGTTAFHTDARFNPRRWARFTQGTGALPSISPQSRLNLPSISPRRWARFTQGVGAQQRARQPQHPPALCLALTPRTMNPLAARNHRLSDAV